MTRHRIQGQPGRSVPRSAGRARVRINDRPLHPRRRAWFGWLGVSVIVLVMAALVVPNRGAIVHYLNRPIVVVKLTSRLNRVDESEVTRLLAAYMHEGFFDINVAGVKRQLESHPWVAGAEVKRIWPNALSVALTEEVAIARWREGSLLNQSGEIFTPSRLDDTSSLPLLTGPENTETLMMEQFHAFNQILYPAGLRIEKLELSERNSWDLEVSGGLRLVAGRVAVREKLKRFASIYDKRIENDIGVIEKIDLRYSNGFTVKRKQQEHSEVAVR